MPTIDDLNTKLDNMIAHNAEFAKRIRKDLEELKKAEKPYALGTKLWWNGTWPGMDKQYEAQEVEVKDIDIENEKIIYLIGWGNARQKWVYHSSLSPLPVRRDCSGPLSQLTWKPEDWAYNEGAWKAIVQLIEIDRDFVRMKDLSGREITDCVQYLRPLVDSDWCVKVREATWRAYRDECDRVQLYGRLNKGGEAFYIDTPSVMILEDFCHHAGIPIMPYNLSNGVYKYPEVK